MLFFLVLSVVLNKNNSANGDKLYLILCFAIMLLLHSGFNPEYSDNFLYKRGFIEFQSMSFAEVLTRNAPSLKAETGYRLLCKVITLFTSNWTIAFAIIGFIMLSGYYSVVRRYSQFYWLSVLLIMVGPFSQSLFVLRQHLAMGIILFTYPYIIEKKVIPFIILCVLAISFHQTAAIFLPVYFLYSIRNNKTLFIVLIIAFIVFFLYFSDFLSVSSSLAMQTAGYGDYYLEYDSENGTNNKTALLLSAILLVRLLIMKNAFFAEGISRLLSITLILGVIVSISGIGFLGTNRLNMYFSETAFLLIPNTAQYIKRKDVRTVFGLCFILFYLYYLIKNANSANMSDFWFFYKH